MISDHIRAAPFLVGDVLAWPSRVYASKPAIEWPSGQISYSDLSQAVADTEAALKLAGVSRGEKWGLLLPSGPDFFVVFLALLRIGCVVSPLRLGLPADRYREMISYAGLSGCISDRDVSRLICVPTDMLGVYKSVEGEIVVLACRRSGTSRGSRPGCSLIDLDPALLLWSSGSTGFPTGVLFSHHQTLCNIWSNICSLCYSDDERTLITLPLSYSYALVAQSLCHLAIGGTIVIPQYPIVGPYLARLLAEDRITNTCTVPPVFEVLVRGLEQTDRDFSCMRLVTIGGARASEEMIARFFAKVGGTRCRLAITYGATEAGPRISTRFVQPFGSHDSSLVGLALPNVDVFIDATSADLTSLGQTIDLSESNVGSIRVRSRSIGQRIGQGGCPAAEQSLDTGDFGFHDESGICLLGRTPLTINKGGLTVSAALIERALRTHPDVESVTVQRKTSARWGEVPLATVRLKPLTGRAVTAEELLQTCKKFLAKDELPDEIVVVSYPAPRDSKSGFLSSLFEDP